MTKNNIWLSLSLCAALVSGCGGDDEACDPALQTGCDTGLVCEQVQDAEPACFAPVLIRGDVFDLVSDGAVGDAHIVALDVNGAAVSSVAISASSGTYELPIPSTRLADGSPTPVTITLRADAAGYLPFPSGLRQALPIDTGTAMDTGDARVVDSSLTDIGLLPLPADSGNAAIFGSVSMPDNRTGVLVVAEADGVGHVGIANRDGDYRIFNVPAGSYTVTAYARGVSYESKEASVDAGGESEIDLALTDVVPGAVSGSVQIVNAPGGSVTSVILVLESTFNELWGRGQAVPGLRAPDSGSTPDITGDYTIEGVPAGRYVVLAAFENDALVRDPDLSIGGTSILHIEVQPDMTTVVAGFKVTEALEIVSPGAREPEAVSGPIAFSWIDDSSEDLYTVELFNGFGELVWMKTMPGVSGSEPGMMYDGETLEPGMYYQFRVTSSKDGSSISRSEDLEGVFYIHTM